MQSQQPAISMFQQKCELLGYKKDLKPFSNIERYAQVESIIKDLVLPTRIELPDITLEEVKTGAMSFYGKYFTLHDVPVVSIEKVKESQGMLMCSKTGAEVAQKFNALCTMTNPFDIPIHLIEGHSMAGRLQKPLILCPVPGYKENIKIPFAHIELGDNLTALSTATYIHEISHVLTESNVGYAESFYNKEVISIFLEKLAALEQDPTGELLKTSERLRFAYLAQMITKLKSAEMLLKIGLITYEDVLNDSVEINSTLLATKLFDNYQKARKLKDKAKILNGIQQVFDGQITVEELLNSQGITIAQAKDTSLIKRHI